jgi:hypothetical protein
VTSAEKYVTAAYAVVLAVVLLYVVIYAFKLQRLDRELTRLAESARERRAADEPLESEREVVETRS